MPTLDVVDVVNSERVRKANAGGAGRWSPLLPPHVPHVTLNLPFSAEFPKRVKVAGDRLAAVPQQHPC